MEDSGDWLTQTIRAKLARYLVCWTFPSPLEGAAEPTDLPSPLATVQITFMKGPRDKKETSLNIWFQHNTPALAKRTQVFLDLDRDTRTHTHTKTICLRTANAIVPNLIDSPSA